MRLKHLKKNLKTLETIAKHMQHPDKTLAKYVRKHMQHPDKHICNTSKKD
jgi:hypothetical protein